MRQNLSPLEQQPKIPAYLGFNPFIDPALESPRGNETRGVAILSADDPVSLGREIVSHCLKMRKTRDQFAREAGL